MAMDLSFLGRGLGFPPRIGADGGFVTSSGPENIRESIRVILLTDDGERVMLPSFGAGLGQFLFHPNTVATHRLIEESIKQSLVRWEPRISLQSVSVASDPESSTTAIATIRYQVVSDQAVDQVSVDIQLIG